VHCLCKKHFTASLKKQKTFVMKKIFIALTAIALFISCKNENQKESLAVQETDFKKIEKYKPQDDVNKSGIVGNISDTIAAPQEET
jgi:hypothetical protein